MEKDPKVKVSKKDRHMQNLHDLSKFLERVNEATVQEVLLLSRNNRETLEEVDEDLTKFSASIDVDSFLLDKSEADLLVLLEELKRKLQNREKHIDKFESDLDNTEVKRADTVSAELKALVDRLIAIAHQLPDDIQRLVENEAFEVNKEVISNRLQHSQTIANFRIKHVQLEYDAIEKWEATRRKWRQLRHDQALDIFRREIRSDLYNDPDDRISYLAKFRQGQQHRRDEIMGHIGTLMQMSYSDIASEAVQAVQAKLSICNEHEVEAIQECYNALTRLRGNTDYMAKERVEDIRKELHVYGSLKVDPKLYLLANRLEDILADPSLAELWRLGGGLKPDVQSLITELTCDEIVYDRVVASMIEKLELIIGSFNLKPIMVEKGRMSQLEKIRGMITKMRSAPRAELAGILTSAVTDFEEINTFEGLPEIFTSTVATIVKEIQEELINLEKRIAMVNASNPAGVLGNGTTALNGTVLGATNVAGQTAALGGTAMTKGILQKTGGGGKPTGKSVTIKGTGKTALGMTGTSSKTKRGGLTGAVSGVVSEPVILTYVDPALVKGWYRKLAILFYGSDLPEAHQQLMLDTLQQATDQRQCNTLVDEVVSAEADRLLVRMDNRYKKLIDKITSFLENQANYLFVQTSNVCDFYLNLARVIEKHRADQKTIDNKSADEIWDISEEFRLELEDREALYEAACQRIRESTKQEEIDKHFADILEILEGIQTSYRTFHQNSCFAADRYPLYLIDEFRNFVMSIGRRLFLLPNTVHPLVTEYNRIFDEVQRLNAPFFEKDPENATGLKRTSIDEELEQLGVGEEYSSPHTSDANAGKSSIAAYYGTYRLLGTLGDFWKRFAQDASFKEPTKEELAAAAAEAAAEVPVTTNAFAALSLYSPHPNCAFFKADATIVPLSNEELANMDAEDVEDYDLALVKAFVNLPENPDVIPPNTTNNFPTLSALEPDIQTQYADVKARVEVIQTRLAEEAQSEYIRQHLPLHARQQTPWIACIEITDEDLDRLYVRIRENIVHSLESEAFRKIAATEREMRDKKQELTDQLEDRIRNHWPRRGRVETEIKQPREKELLSHQEKTYRMVTSLQQKVIDFQANFDRYLEESQAACDTYIQSMTGFRGQLHGHYKNLAVLQGIDQKARACSLLFQQDAAERVTKLQKWTSQDIEVIMQNAKEFRKICPVQVPGQPPIPGGGYSESELQEIETLILQQCQEIVEVREGDWQPRTQHLQEYQEQCLKSLGEFTAQFLKCSQEVAMAEGLGQKYGAPRRRAQERIRSEVARDERFAGKIDEYLAQIEFIAAEIMVSSQQPEQPLATETLTEANAAAAVTAVPARSWEDELTAMLLTMTPAEAHEALRKLDSIWRLLKSLRDAANQRISFLDILGDQGLPPLTAVPNDKLPWYLESRLMEKYTTTPSSSVTFAPGVISPGHGGSIGSPSGGGGIDPNNLPGMAALMDSLQAVYDDVYKICCQETKDLYMKEGLQAMLTGNNGIPESLAVWLDESKHKLLGRHGYQEKAWKKVWSQMERLDFLFGRNRAQEKETTEGGNETTRLEATQMAVTTSSSSSPGNPPSALAAFSKYKLSIQSACIIYFLQGCLTFARYDYNAAQEALQKVLKVWSLGREKHERMLRPRLGSPDKADELKDLDAIEKKRSQEMTQHVIGFRTAVIRNQLERFRVFCEDLGLLTKGLLYLLDGIYRQELVRLPPDTEIPKKHMTLKKLRKAQRIREEVARGNADRSVKRVWPGIILDPARIPADSGMNSETVAALPNTVHIVKGYEDLVHDLGQQPSDTTAGEAIEIAGLSATEDAGNTSPRGKGKAGGKDAPKDAKKAAPPAKKGGKDTAVSEPAVGPPSLLPDPWQEKVRTLSETEALVSSAHRIVINERTQAIQRYTGYLREILEDVKEQTSTLLTQEESWNARWDRQVNMLKQGQL